jgi:hypothetical protein
MAEPTTLTPIPRGLSPELDQAYARASEALERVRQAENAGLLSPEATALCAMASQALSAIDADLCRLNGVHLARTITANIAEQQEDLVLQTRDLEAAGLRWRGADAAVRRDPTQAAEAAAAEREYAVRQRIRDDSEARLLASVAAVNAWVRKQCDAEIKAGVLALSQYGGLLAHALRAMPRAA